MRKFHKILDGLKNNSQIPKLLENGYTPETIKTEIINTFKPYFKNHTNLEEYAISYLVSDWINFLKMKTKYPEIEKDIEKVLLTYEEAKVDNCEGTIKIVSEMMDLHVEHANKFWSILNLEVDKKDLEIHEFTYTVMTDISNIIEGVSKSLYIENVLINKIRRRKSVDVNKTKSNKLGSLIQDLIDNSIYGSIFITPIGNLKVSDWRNIGAHHTYTIKNSQIHCISGEGVRKINFEIDKKELYEILKYCVRTFEVLNMAHKIFTFDNLPAISNAVNKKNYNARPEIDFLMFSSALMSQGFEIKSINYDSEYALLELLDLTQGDPLKRGIHASQFLNGLWLLTNSELLNIRYLKNDGNLFLTSSIKCEIFHKMEEDSKKDVSYFAENVNFKLASNSGGNLSYGISR